MNTVSGFYGSQSVNINVDEDIEIIGAVVIGPDGDTHVVSDRFCYRNVDEYGWSKSTSVNAGFIWDMRNMQFGSGIPVTIDTDYHHKVEEGTTHATIAGDDSIDGINHNRNTIQTRNVVKDKHVRVFVPVIDPVAFRESLDVIFAKDGMADIDAVREELLDASSESNVFDSSDEVGIAVSTDEHYTIVSGNVADTDGKGAIDYVEAIDWTVEGSGELETFIEHNTETGTVTIGVANAQRKTTIRMSEERFLGFMQYERVESTGNEVLDDAYYHCSHDGFGDEQIALSRESAIAEAMLEFSSRFAQGVGEGVLNVFTGAWDFLNAYADWQEKARNDFDAFDEELKTMSKSVVEAVQSEAFWISKAEAIAETLSTPEGLGRITGEILVIGVMGEIASVIEAGVIEGTRGLSIIKQHNVVKRTAGEVNEGFAKKGWGAPYKPGTPVYEFELAEDAVFMRAYAEHIKDGVTLGTVGDWMTYADEIKGLSSKEIKAKLALKRAPTHIVEVHVPKGTKIRTGEINPLFGEPGGAVQFELIDRLGDESYKNIKRL